MSLSSRNCICFFDHMIVLVVVTAAGMDVRSSIGKRLFSVFKAMALL